MMTAWAIDANGKGYFHKGGYKTEDGAIRKLLSLLPCPVELRSLGAERVEVTAEWMMANYTEL